MGRKGIFTTLLTCTGLWGSNKRLRGFAMCTILRTDTLIEEP